MKQAFLFCASAAALIVAAGMAADVGKLPSVNTKSQRNVTNGIPMVAPDGKGSNPFFQQVPVFTTNGLINSGLSKALRSEGEEENSPEIYGFVISASSYGQGYGLRKIPMHEGEQFVSVPGGASYASQVTSGAESDGIFYTNNLVSRYGEPYCVYYNAYDMTNNYQTAVNPSQSSDFLYAARDMATDPITGDIYACAIKTSSCTNYVLARIEYSINTATRSFAGFKRDAICDLDNILTGLFFTADGQLWGIDMITDVDEDNNPYTKSSSLYKIDKNTGAMTLVGETGALPYYVSSVCCDMYNTGNVYWSIKDINNVGSLYTIDLETGAATKMFDYPNNEEVVAMFVPIKPSKEVPAAPANVKANFPDGGLSGEITFQVPDTLAGGQTATGEVEWTVSTSGTVIGSGVAAYGEEVGCEATVNNAGMYSFSVRLKNESGNSSRVQVEQYVGTGVPATPQPVAAYTSGKIMVAWEPITGAEWDRGYVDVDNMTYKVVRYPDQTVVSEGTKNTSYIEDVPADAPFGYYQYGVYAVAGDAISSEGKTGSIVVGKITPPYLETFDDTSLIGSGDKATTGVYPNYDLDGSTLGHWYIHGMDRAATCSTGFGNEDSWLMTPAFALEEGKSYTLSFDAYTSFVPNTEDKYSRLEISVGSMQHPSGMTQSIMPVETITNLKANKAFKVYDFTVPATGTYYFGLHCCTMNGGAQVYVDNLSIEESPEPGLPGPATDVKLSASATGSLTATLTGKAPILDNRGQALSGTMTIDAMYDGEVIETKENVAPGEEFSFQVTAAKGGDTYYSVRASNEKGSGKTVSANCYLGFYDPRTATDVKLARNEADKTFKLSWTAPTQDVKWNNLTASDLTYKVLGADSEGHTTIIVDNIDGNTTEATFSDPAVDFEGEQKFVYYGVVACSNGGTSSIAVSNILPVGKAYKAPYTDSFSGEPAGIYNVSMGSTLGEWILMNDESILDAGIASQDGDNGFIGFYAGMWNTQGVLQTGMIDLEGLETPGVSFYMYNLYLDPGFDDNQIFIAVNVGGSEYYMLKAEADIVGNYGKMNSWCKYTVSLAPFKGQKVSIMIVPTTITYVWSFIDNLKVDNLPEYDLSAGPSAGTPLIEDGDTGLYLFNVINNGYNTANDFTIDLLRNDKSVRTRGVRELAAGGLVQIQMTDKPDVDAAEESEYKARVTITGEADDTDNESDPILTQIVLPAYPTVDEITGEINATTGAALNWEEPNLDYVPNPITETFERATPWATSYEDWTFIDVDQAPINMGTANGIFGEEIITGSTQSFFLMDVSLLDEIRQGSTAFAAHSGTKYLMKCAPGDVYTAGDDWAITPELYGNAQTISLWAHSHSSGSPENIEGLYSTGSLDPADFISISKHLDVPTGWTRYEFEVPEGAKRFAIRCHSAATFFIQIDDITYQPMPKELDLLGYHIWRNGERITEEPTEDTTYVDADAKEGDTYRISAVYHLGESVPGAVFSPAFNGIEDMLADNIRIYAEDGAIYINGASGRDIKIFSTDGSMIKSVLGLYSNVISVDKGIYIVKVGKHTAKVIVK